MFMKNVQVHNYDSRQRDHYHVLGFKSRLGKTNFILTSGVPVDVSQAVFFQTIEMYYN